MIDKIDFLDKLSKDISAFAAHFWRFPMSTAGAAAFLATRRRHPDEPAGKVMKAHGDGSAPITEELPPLPGEQDTAEDEEVPNPKAGTYGGQPPNCS